jgi:hypothetical protein
MGGGDLILVEAVGRIWPVYTERNRGEGGEAAMAASKASSLAVSSAMMLSLVPRAGAAATAVCTPTQLTPCALALVGDVSPTAACSEGRGEVDVVNP